MKQSIVEKLFLTIQKQKEALTKLIKTPGQNHAMLTLAIWPDGDENAKPNQHKFASIMMGSSHNIKQMLVTAMEENPEFANEVQDALVQTILQKWDGIEEEGKCNNPLCPVHGMNSPLGKREEVGDLLHALEVMLSRMRN